MDFQHSKKPGFSLQTFLRGSGYLSKIICLVIQHWNIDVKDEGTNSGLANIKVNVLPPLLFCAKFLSEGMMKKKENYFDKIKQTYTVI